MRKTTSQTCWTAVTVLLSLSLLLSPVSAKCVGKWAIHACFGGNGKRSDPSLEAVPRPSLLRQLLLRNSPAFPMAAGPLMPDVASDESFEIPSLSSEYPDFAPALSPADRLSALVNTLRNLQKENADLA